MRTLRIRTFTLLCFFFILTVPWIFYVTAHFMETNTFSFSKQGPQNEFQQRNLNETIRMIESNPGEWQDPEWQRRLDAQLRQAKMDAVITSASGREIYRSNAARRGTMSAAEQFSIIENGRLIGKVAIYMPKSLGVGWMSILAGLLLAFFVVGMEMRRFLLKPLEKMSLAARRIAAGDEDVRLPGSRIAEIAEVRDGFQVMLEGLEQASRKQAALEEERRFVVAAVAHDLRTPLFALRGYLDGLEQGIARSPEKMAKYLAVCKEKSAQLDRLVEDLFAFAKMEYLDTKLNNGIVNLSHVLRKSVESVNPYARQKSISISSYAEENCFVSGDGHLLERAMSNLFDNAVRHTPPGGEIRVECAKDGDRVKFAIRDTGPGFSAEELERVFEPLYRGESSRNRSTGGSGLGLTISQKIVRRHGGDLEAGNHPEGGALLTGFMPAADSDSPNICAEASNAKKEPRAFVP